MEENLVTKAIADMIIDGTLDNIKKRDPKQYEKIMEAQARVCLGRVLQSGTDYLKEN